MHNTYSRASFVVSTVLLYIVQLLYNELSLLSTKFFIYFSFLLNRISEVRGGGDLRQVRLVSRGGGDLLHSEDKVFSGLHIGGNILQPKQISLYLERYLNPNILVSLSSDMV